MSSFQSKKIDITPKNVEQFIIKYGEASIQRKANELIEQECNDEIIHLNEKNWMAIKKAAEILNESPSWVVNEIIARVETVCSVNIEKTKITITKSPVQIKVRNQNNPITNY